MTTAIAPIERDDVNMTIGHNVHELLFNRRARQVQLAATMGITSSVLSKKLRGESGWSATHIQAAADFLGVSPGQLFEKITIRCLPPYLAADTDRPSRNGARALLAVVK